MKKIGVLCLILVAGVSVVQALVHTSDIEARISREKSLLAGIESELDHLNSIIYQRDRVRSYEDNGKNDLIISLFSAVSRELEDSFKTGDDWRIRSKHQEMIHIFRDIDLVEDRYLFYDALYLYYNREIDQAEERLLNLINVSPESVKLRPALSLLQTILIFDNRNRELLELTDRFSYLSDNRSRYFTAHAHFNLKEYVKAEAIFSELIRYREYRFRSEIMLGLIQYAIFHSDRAIQHLEQLTHKYEPSEQYYDFLLLSLARIFGENEDFRNSLRYYNSLIDFNSGQLTDELAFEIALIERASGNYKKALYYLNHIINMPEKSSIYDEAVIMIAGIMVHTSSYKRSTDLINDVLQTNRAFNNMLHIEVNLLRDMREAAWQYVITGDNNKRKEFNRLSEKYWMITERDRDFEKSSLSGVEHTYNHLVMAEYVSFLNLIIELNDVAEKIKSLPNTEQVNQIESQITEIDHLRKNLLTTKFLVNLTKDVTRIDDNPLQPLQFHSRYIYLTEMNQMLLESYMLARELADKIVMYENIREDFGAALNHDEISKLHNILDLLNQESEIVFGSMDFDNKLISQIEEENLSLLGLRRGLSAIRELVERSYHQKVAERLINNNINSLDISDFSYDYSIFVISKTAEELNQISKKYDYALLDVLFQESIRRDQEYRSNLEKLNQSATQERER